MDEGNVHTYVSTNERLESLEKLVIKQSAQLKDIHDFISLLNGALESPMLRAMLPPNMREMLNK